MKTVKTKRFILLFMLLSIFSNINYGQSYKFLVKKTNQEINLDTIKYKGSILKLRTLIENKNMFNQKFIKENWESAKITFFNEESGEISIQQNLNKKRIVLDQYFNVNFLEITNSSHLSILIGSNEALIMLMSPTKYEIYATDFNEKYGKPKERFLKDLEETILEEFNIKKY